MRFAPDSVVAALLLEQSWPAFRVAVKIERTRAAEKEACMTWISGSLGLVYLLPGSSSPLSRGRMQRVLDDSLQPPA